MGELDAGRFAATYAALWAAHDLADHVAQTDHQAATKATSWRGMAGHVGGYGVTQALALAALHRAGVRQRPLRALAGLAVSLGTHAFLDRRWPVVDLLCRTGSARFASPSITLPETEVLSETPRNHEMRAARTVAGPRGLVPGWAALRGTAQETSTALPLHGPYLADQALHHICVALAAAVAAGGRRA